MPAFAVKLEAAGDPATRGMGGQADGVIAQDLLISHLDHQRWQATQVEFQRTVHHGVRRQLVPTDGLFDPAAVDHRVGMLAGLVAG